MAGWRRGAPGQLTSRNRRFASEQTAFLRRSAPALPGGRVAGHRSSGKGPHQELPLGQFVHNSTLWGENKRPNKKRTRLVERAGYVTAETVSLLCGDEHLSEAVEALGLLVQRDSPISKSLFYTVLKKCVAKKHLVLGRRVHAFTARKGYQSDSFLCNHILRMYASLGRMQEAMHVFNGAAYADAFMWSSIISAHAKHGQDKEAIQLYRRMRRSSVKPDCHVFVAALQACARGADLQTGQELHADVLGSGVEPDLFVYNCLVDMYAKCGSLEDARRVFDGLGEKDVVTWSAMIAGYGQQGMGHEALGLYRAMQDEGIVAPNSVTFTSLLQACATVGIPVLEEGKQLHAEIRERGFEGDEFIASSLVNMYAKCGSLGDAQRVFDGLGQKDLVTWNAMIAGYSQKGMGQEALDLYSALQADGMVAPDSVTFVSLLQACACMGPLVLEKGKELHAQIRERGLEANVFVTSGLLDMYSKCSSLEAARRVFDGLGQKDVVTWNAIIALYSQHGMGREALHLYSAMEGEGNAEPDSVTFVSLLQACATMGSTALERGRQIHMQIREQGHQDDVFVASSLVNMYAKCGSLEDAQRVFGRLGQKDLVTWNTMISGYAQQGMGQQALHVYSVMQEESTAIPNSVTFVCLLLACARVGATALHTGKQLHAQIRQQGYQADVLVANSLVNMYSKCGSLEDAQRVFEGLGHKDVTTWNAMIAAYSQQGMGQEALHLYKAMQEEGMAVPDAGTFVCLLQGCANVAALHVGRQLHAQIVEQGLQADALLAHCLISMYGKCGSMFDAQQVFEELCDRNIVAWNALIGGYCRQGNVELVLDLVVRMREDGVQPDGVTFVGVLMVCSHAGLVSRGQEYFQAMSSHYSITPTLEHYTCMVDLLGRAGLLDEALALIRTMPVLPDAAVWYTLLGACQKWSNVDAGRHAFDHAVKLDVKDAAAYVFMSNIYKGARMWGQAREIQKRRIRMRAWKQPGYSWWTDMAGLVHCFLVAGTKHPKA